MKKRNLVFSTDPEEMSSIENEQRTDPSAILGDGKVRILLETKGRKGKGVSIITGLAMTAAELKKLAKEFKALCGSGGAIKDGNIEIQGDHRDKLLDALAKKNIQAKKAGG